MNDKRKLIIVGTGLFAEVSKAYFEEYTDYEVIAFACHKKYKEKESIFDRPLHTIETLRSDFPKQHNEVFVAIGYGRMNKMRQSVYREVKSLGYNTPSFIHPGVKIWDSTSIGDNVFIFEDNTIQPFTSIGNNTILWSGNHIGHHSKIGSHCFISSHVVISGSCNIGDNTFVGVNSTFHDSISVGKSVLIGAGAIIGENIDDDSVYSPKRTTKFKKTSKEVGF
tara:strand:+ start:21 stop:689 length:669 start_codon:yes stop_codon:yes gene_type:complete